MFRFSLAQVLLLTALAAVIVTVVTVTSRRISVLYNEPSIAISPDGSRLISGHMVRPLQGRSHPVSIRDLDTGKTEYLEAHSWCITDVAYSPDNTKIYSTGDRSLRIWDAVTREELNRIDTGQPQEHLAVSPDGKYVATSADGVIKVWDAYTGKQLHEFTRKSSRYNSDLVFSPDGSYLASSSLDRELVVYDTTTWQQTITLKRSASRIAFTSDSMLVNIDSSRPKQQQIQLQELPSGDVKQTFDVASWGAISCTACSPDGRYLAAAHAGSDRSHHAGVSVWDLTTNERVSRFNLDEHSDHWIDAMSFSPNGSTLYCASQNNVVTARVLGNSDTRVLFASSRSVPWLLATIGAIIWGFAWYFTPRIKNDLAKHHANDYAESLGTQ